MAMQIGYREGDVCCRTINLPDPVRQFKGKGYGKVLFATVSLCKTNVS